eukprot:m.170089 g.170089  ORF g.170089 m.170089 type:complete len:553 (-) comp13193_c0_seq1:267-1925(-)
MTGTSSWSTGALGWLVSGTSRPSEAQRLEQARAQIAKLAAYSGAQVEKPLEAGRQSDSTLPPSGPLGPEPQETEPETTEGEDLSDDDRHPSYSRTLAIRRPRRQVKGESALGTLVNLRRDSPAGSFGFSLLNSPAASGLRVLEVTPGTPAALAGITPNSVITEVDGKRVLGLKYKDVCDMLGQANHTLRVRFLSRTGAVRLLKSEAVDSILGDSPERPCPKWPNPSNRRSSGACVVADCDSSSDDSGVTSCGEASEAAATPSPRKPRDTTPRSTTVPSSKRPSSRPASAIARPASASRRPTSRPVSRPASATARPPSASRRPASATKVVRGPPTHTLSRANARANPKTTTTPAPRPLSDTSDYSSADEMAATRASTEYVPSPTNLPTWQFDSAGPAAAHAATDAAADVVTDAAAEIKPVLPPLEGVKEDGVRIKMTGSKLYPSRMGVYYELEERHNDRPVFGRSSKDGFFYLYHTKASIGNGQWRISNKIGRAKGKVTAFSNMRSPLKVSDWYEAVGAKTLGLQQHQPNIKIREVTKEEQLKKGGKSCAKQA